MNLEAKFNVAIVAQAGRIGYQALLCAASIRAFHSAKHVPIFICIPKHSDRWSSDPSINDIELIKAFEKYDCKIAIFDNADFGSRYPHSNKFYAILALPEDQPFLFLDSDTVLVEPFTSNQFQLDRPALKLGGETWPVQNSKTRSVGEVWRLLYAFFGLDAEPYRDVNLTDAQHQCYPYYNAGILYYSRAREFGQALLSMARRVWFERPDALEDQPLKPWLDQIVLPIALAQLGIPRSEVPDPIHKAIIHYHFPFYLQVRYARAERLFADLSKDNTLSSVLKNDTGFKYYMSEEGQNIVRAVYEKLWSNPENRNYKAFEKELRRRVLVMR